MKLQTLLLSFLIGVSTGICQPFFLEQPLYSHIQQYEEDNGGVLTTIDNPDYLDDFRYPYKKIYKVGAPEVYVLETNELYLYRQYYKSEDNIVRFIKHVWTPIKPNSNVQQKNKLIEKDKLTYGEYVSLFDSIYKSIAKQLELEPTEIIGLDTIYKDGKIYYSYKSASWYTDNRSIHLFYLNSNKNRNITLYTHWFSNEDKEKLRTMKYGKVYPVVNLTKVPSFSYKGGGVQKYVQKNFKPKTKITKKNATRVFAILTLSSTGQVSEVEIVKGTDAKLIQELKFFLATMPHWNAGEFEGKKVACELNVPIDLTTIKN